MLLFTTSKAILVQIYDLDPCKFALSKELHFIFTVSRVEPYGRDFVLYANDKISVFNVDTFKISRELLVSSDSWFGGNNIEVTKLGLVKLADSSFYLDEMPLNVFYTTENAVIDMSTNTMIITNTGNFII